MTKAKIMIVEDETIIAMDMRKSLNNLGYDVPALVSSAEDAVKKAGEIQPDLVLMDIVPAGDIDGIEDAEQIRTRLDIPVIFLTAYGDKKTLERAKVTGPFGYILKPFGERELHIAIEMALYRHKTERKLNELQQWVSASLKSIGDAVIVTDTEGHVTFMNHIAEELTGWKQEEAFRKPLREIFRIVDPGTDKPVKDLAKIVLQKGVIERLSRNTALIIKDGTMLPIDGSGAPVKNDRGKAVGAIFVFHDITEQKKYEKTLKLLAENAMKNRDAFFSMLEDISESFKELKELFMTLVKAMVNALDAKSTWTKGHSERVATYAERIAVEMGIEEEEIENLRLAGLLHDIGKIGTYDVILDKPGKLTDEEFALIKTHPAQGATILKDIKQLKDIIPLVRGHHERIDGRGYPDGLKGEDIPFGARILHVADSFDSMTADRPYRPSPGREYATSEFKRCKGTQFDPLVVEAFLKVLDKFP